MKQVAWERISLFEDFPPQWLGEVRALFDMVQVPAGQDLLREGEQGDELFILVSGRVRITKSMLLEGMRLTIMESEDPRKVLATLDESSYPIFGEIALLDSDQRSATVGCVVDSEFLRTTRERFFDLVRRKPEIGCRLFSILGKRLAATVRKNNQEMIKLSTALALALSRTRRT